MRQHAESIDNNVSNIPRAYAIVNVWLLGLVETRASRAGWAIGRPDVRILSDVARFVATDAPAVGGQ
jgi:hypothetical protein